MGLIKRSENSYQISEIGIWMGTGFEKEIGRTWVTYILVVYKNTEIPANL